jgi:hypothetical protein
VNFKNSEKEGEAQKEERFNISRLYNKVQNIENTNINVDIEGKKQRSVLVSFTSMSIER